MKIFNHLFTRHYYRSAIFWLLITLSLYSVVGFYLAPKIIKSNIISQVEDNLGWQTKIERVELNPFLLTLRISNLSIIDKNNISVISFDSFFNDFELRSIFEGAFTFASVELQSPIINLVIDKDGVTNIQRALLLQQSKEQQKLPVTDVNKKNELPKLLFDNISVAQGNITITDQTLAKEKKHQIKPINFKLQNFSTLLKRDANYQLNLELGEQQRLQWQGNIALSPFSSEGKINVEGLQVHKFWDYIEQKVPYHLLNTTASFTGNYKFSLKDATPAFEMNDTLITLDKIKLAYKNNPQSFVDIDKMSIGPLDFDLNQQNIIIKQVQIDNLNLQLERDQKGALSVLAPFTEQNVNGSEQKRDTNSIDTDDESQWHWQLAQLKLLQSNIIFTDNQPKKTANINLNNINLQLNEMSNDLSQALPFELEYAVNQSGHSKIKGDVTPAPIKLNVAVSVENLALSTIQPYLSEFAKIEIKKGQLSANGNLNFAQTPQQDITGGFIGTLNIKQFDTNDLLLNQRLVGWHELSVQPLTVNFNPLSIAINEVALTQPYIRLIVTPERSINFAQLAVVDTKNKEQTKQKSEIKEPTSVVPIKIDKISLKDGNAYFADLSLIPEFATSIEQLNGNISGLSSAHLARADVDIKGTIEEYGKMAVFGKINPLSDDIYTDITADFDKIELTTLTPYSGRYAGYVIDKGKLSLQLNYKIANRKLDGSNRLILDQFELGETVSSEESLDLPLKLALALFKDSDGIIDINMPTKGDLDDPDFKISGLVMQAFLNVISKAISSPFSLLADLVDGDPDDLNSIAFEFGRSQLDEEQVKHLQTLSTLLLERPELVLEVRVFIDKEKDRVALQKELLNKQLNEKNIALDDIDAVQQFYLTEIKNSDLEKLQSAATIKNNDDTEAKLDNKIYKTLLQQALLDAQIVSDLDLITLAKQRVSIIKGELIQKNKVANKQVFAMHPSLDGVAENNKIKTQFTLNSN